MKAPHLLPVAGLFTFDGAPVAGLFTFDGRLKYTRVAV
ncbi:hypothetical protein LTSEMON_4572 [Salmonella enterica subsp. enterica serovar Montevideo str. S5-403]|uniref:Uncharacterized protein n=1 Tax=Salmonella enterica subsp. enterica serovar Montevideo str. S5-403 TaxID=913242 RepID=G5Q889_SALMO|nr:hypothetical protein LTSEMON_4572 [Salmonella enterica subsp. enterica serovar Montevideo str. S5-403]